MRAATSFGREMYTTWLAPEISTTPLFARDAYQRSRSGLMVRSAPATNIQLGLLRQAAVVIVAEKLSAKFKTCERAMKAAMVRRKVGSKQFVEPPWVNISETVRQFLDGA